MESESDTEEFYDAAEELSPLRAKQRDRIEKVETEDFIKKQETIKAASTQLEKSTFVEDVEQNETQRSSVSKNVENSEQEVNQQDQIEKIQPEIEKQQAEIEKHQSEIEKNQQKVEKKQSEIENKQSEVGEKQTEVEKKGPPPRPVAPPRRKRQQKKEALAKEKEILHDSGSTQKPHAKPPRPSKPPCQGSSSAVCKEFSTPVTKKENQPFITVNANATDMDEVLMKGSSLNIVQNRDLDEFKSPAGSKNKLDKDNTATSTPSGAITYDDNSAEQVVTKRNSTKSTQSHNERPLSDIEILEQVIVKNLDTGETIPLSLAEEKLPQCTNPLALQIMRLTSEYSSDSNLTALSEDGHLSDSSMAPSIKIESKRKKFKKFIGKTVQKIKSVADEVKARREETSSSDEDEVQESYCIKMKTHKAIRDRRAFERIQLLQDLSGEHIGAIWTMKFSLCGRLIAAAGQDNIVRVWVLKEAQSFFDEMRAKYARVERGSPTSSINSINSITSAEEDITLEEDSFKDELQDAGPFSRSPFCTYHGHTSDVLDLSWSKNYFILSSSMDKTVRLWHISRNECLCCFQHVDFVTAICFHPKDDRYFLSGSLDGKIRLWNIPEKRVALWNEIDGSGTSLITAANFCREGKLAVVGTYDGRCIFYDTERLKYHTQLTVRSTRGKNARGRKISGIEPMPGEDKVLITSNDSRVRLYDLKDHSLYCKYKGSSNSSSQIKASFSHDGRHIVCGSEDHFIYIWKTYHDIPNVRKDRSEYYESFSAHDAVVTSAVFAPIPSLFSPLTESTDAKEHASGNNSNSDTLHHCEVLATADWSGAIKLFVNR